VKMRKGALLPSSLTMLEPELFSHIPEIIVILSGKHCGWKSRQAFSIVDDPGKGFIKVRDKASDVSSDFGHLMPVHQGERYRVEHCKHRQTRAANKWTPHSSSRHPSHRCESSADFPQSNSVCSYSNSYSNADEHQHKRTTRYGQKRAVSSTGKTRAYTGEQCVSSPPFGMPNKILGPLYSSSPL
jgi:hypothetical protein